MSAWVSSSALRTSRPKLAEKRKAESSGRVVNNKKIKNKEIPENGTWIERFEPQSKDELAVHKKKIDEVDGWLKKNILASESKHNIGKAPILLLVGPTGSGKSITLKVLAKENAIHVKEWMHPLTVDTGDYAEEDRKYAGWNEAREKVIENFNEFLFQGSRYKSLFDEEHRRIIVLEDIPFTFLKHVGEFHNCLRKYRKFGRCPLAISLCETSSSREFKLFPQEIKTELDICCISFNSVAVTFLTKAIKGIIQQASSEFGKAFRRPDEAEVISVIQCCDGDLRLAINLFEVATRSSSEIVKKVDLKKKKEKRNTEDEKLGDTLKDSSLYLFHSLGKILYAKREGTVLQRLPLHLKHLEKPQLKEIPEEVFDRTCVSQDIFLRMLHNNASNFYDNIGSAASCLEWLSFGDYLNCFWDPDGVMNSLGISATLRGLMFHLQKPTGKTHFGSFKKPSFDRRKVENRLNEVRHQFLLQSTSTNVLVRDMLPYAFIIRPESLSQEQWNVINDCFLVRRTMSSSWTTQISLSEKFVPEEDEEDSTPVNILEEKECVTELTPNNEIEIEEIDSD